MSIDYIKRLIGPDMEAMDEVIRIKLHSEVVLVRQVGEYIINSGGKRLRPTLVVLSAGALGYEGKYHHSLAAIIEFIHTATLLHDDVVDESELRRNKATANALFGNAASVLVGDFLYSRSFQMMVEVNNMKIMEVLADATNTIAEGEVLQLLNCRNPDVNEENYLRVIRYKTAKLFEAATRLGAIISNASPDIEASMAAYGMHLGTAFQLTDDMLDYSGNYQDIGKNLGDDLSEGKPTLPLIYAMKIGSKEQNRIISEAIKNGGNDGMLESVLEVIHETDSLDYTRKKAEAESCMAVEKLSMIPNSDYKDCLLKLATFAVERNY